MKITQITLNNFRQHKNLKIELDASKSSFTIVEGMMKLRQICDSPAILNEEEEYPNHSVKLEELLRELEEKGGPATETGQTILLPR